jgi:predicted nucleic acid-binding Zn ribbon protein
LSRGTVPKMVWKPLRTDPAEVEPRLVGSALPQVTRRFGLASPQTLNAVFARWEEMVGSPLGHHCTPVALRDSVLTVTVDEPGWATEIRYLHDDLVRRINEVAGAGAVTRVEVRRRESTGAQRAAARRAAARDARPSTED